MKNSIRFAAKAAKAAANDETKVEKAWQDMSATPKRIPARSMKSVSVALAAEAGDKKGTGRKYPTKGGLFHMSAHDSRSSVSETGDTGCTSPLDGLRSRPTRVLPVPAGFEILPAKCRQEVISTAMHLNKTITRSAEDDEATKTGATAIGTQGTSVPYVPVEEKGADVKMQTNTEVAKAVWDSARNEERRAEFDAITIATQTSTLGQRPAKDVDRDDCC